MLFCPFCGAAIVIPEQDEPVSEPRLEDMPAADSHVESAVAAPEEGTAGLPATDDASAEESPSGDDEARQDAAAELLDWSRSRRRVADEWARPESPEEPFTPLNLEEAAAEAPEDWRGEIEKKKEAAQPEKKPPRMRVGEGEPVRLEGSAPKLELSTPNAKPLEGGQKGSRRHANTLVPPKTMDPNDIFMDDRAAAYDDAYDAYDDAPAGQDFADEGFVYEDEGESSFFMRHLRGIVGLALFVILILMFVIYAFSKSGQYSLAKVNLAWSTKAYVELGDQSYQNRQFSQAGTYYERALQRDAGNYAYASAAAIAYTESGETDKAAAMLKRCVEINPTLLEPYIYLLKLYPDAASRPWDVTQVLQKGYQMTGDSRLNVTG